MTDKKPLTSTRAYIVRAIYQWINDNGMTPYILANASVEGTEVPQNYVKHGRIVLNVAPDAVTNLLMENDYISFNGRFSGVDIDIYLPIQSVLAIYARENTQGVFFEKDGDLEPPPPEPRPRQARVNSVSSSTKTSKPFLKVVK